MTRADHVERWRRSLCRVRGRRSPASVLQAQGRGGGEWTTSGFDAQRTGWVRTDPRISLETMSEARRSSAPSSSSGS